MAVTSEVLKHIIRPRLVGISISSTSLEPGEFGSSFVKFQKSNCIDHFFFVGDITSHTNYSEYGEVQSNDFMNLSPLGIWSFYLDDILKNALERSGHLIVHFSIEGDDFAK